PLVEVHLRRVVDDVLGHRRAHLAVTLVQELTRDRMLRLEDVTALDDHTAVPLVDDGAELVVVACDHGLPVHGTPFARSPPGISPIRPSFKRLLGWPPDEREHTDGR